MLQPLHDRILIKAVPIPEKIGNLYIPKNEDHRPGIGTIVRCGKDVPAEITPGKKIFYLKHAPVEVFVFDGKGDRVPDMFMIRYEDVDGFDDGLEGESLPK